MDLEKGTELDFISISFRLIRNKDIFDKNNCHYFRLLVNLSFYILYMLICEQKCHLKCKLFGFCQIISIPDNTFFLNVHRVHRAILCLHSMFPSVCNPHPSFEAVYCINCGRRRVAVARYRIICLVLTVWIKHPPTCIFAKCRITTPWAGIQQFTRIIFPRKSDTRGHLCTESSTYSKRCHWVCSMHFQKKKHNYMLTIRIQHVHLVTG